MAEKTALDQLQEEATPILKEMDRVIASLQEQKGELNPKIQEYLRTISEDKVKNDEILRDYFNGKIIPAPGETKSILTHKLISALVLVNGYVGLVTDGLAGACPEEQKSQFQKLLDQTKKLELAIREHVKST